MLQDIFDSILATRSDRSALPQLHQIAVKVRELDDGQVDQLLEYISDLGDELCELKASEPENDTPPHQPPASPIDFNAIGAKLDLIIQPLIQQLIVRELNRRAEPSQFENEANLQDNQQDNRSENSQTVGSQSRSQSVSADEVHEDAGSNATSGSATESGETSAANGWSQQRLQDIESIYRFSPLNSELRNQILRWIGTSAQPHALEIWLDLICDDPPEHRLGIGLAFAPLTERQFIPQPNLLQRLLTKGTTHAHISPAIFDLFNFYVRTGKLKTHPAAGRLDELTGLYQQLCRQMQQIETGNFQKQLDVGQINRQVSDAVALLVSLSDLFSLTLHRPAIPFLKTALELRHRRVQTEAAAALTRLSDDDGKQTLIRLADQPISRLRVLAYAEELGFLHEISLELQGEIARRESELAIWLAQPQQMGLAPSQMELLDQREMYWPSYDQPQNCFLFRYAYGVGPQAHSNIGICGPLTHAFAADLRHLPIEEMYAAFAGWQTVHQDIFQMTPYQARQTRPALTRRRERILDDGNYDEVVIQAYGSFLGEWVLIATACYEGKVGTIVVDDHDSTWFDQGHPQAPIDWKLAYAIWRGKQLLARFNQSETF